MTTDRLGFDLPIVGGDDDLWGEKLNAALQRMDDSSGFSVLTFGATGQGSGSDRVAIQDAIDTASLTGIALQTVMPVNLVPGGLHLVDYSGNGLNCLALKPFIQFNLNGATVKMMDNQADSSRSGGTTVMSMVTQTLGLATGGTVPGSTTGTSLNTDTPSAFSVGQIFEAFGEYMQVVSIAGSTLTVTRAIYGVATAGITAFSGGTPNSTQSLNAVYENVHVVGRGAVDGNKAGQSSFQFDHDAGILIGYGVNCSVTGVEVRNPRADSINFLASVNCTGSKNNVHGGERCGLNLRQSSFCSFENNDVTQLANYGMKMEHTVGDFSCYGNSFINNRVIAGGLISLSGISGVKLYDMKVEDNTFNIGQNTANLATPISLISCDGFKVTNNTLNGTTTTSIAVTRDCIGGLIKGNTCKGFIGTATDLGGAIKIGGSSVTSVDDIVVTENSVIGAPQAGISIQANSAGVLQPRRIIVTRNKVKDCGLQGMYIASGDDCIITENELTNNGGNAVASGVTNAANCGILFQQSTASPHRTSVKNNKFNSDGTSQVTGIDCVNAAAAVDATITDNEFNNTTTPIANLSRFTGSPRIRDNRSLNGGGQAGGTGTIHTGSGVPSDANLGVDGDFYGRTDGVVASNTVWYHKQSGAWVAMTTT
jgi:parallel beta-helix repeat protein